MSGDNFICANCGNRDEVDKHGRCTACQSEQVFPDRFPISLRGKIHSSEYRSVDYRARS